MFNFILQTFHRSSNGIAYFGGKKSSVAENESKFICARTHNQIILHQQLSNPDKLH